MFGFNKTFDDLTAAATKAAEAAAGAASQASQAMVDSALKSDDAAPGDCECEFDCGFRGEFD